MRVKLWPSGLRAWVGICLALLACASPLAQAADLKLQTQLVWGTDDAAPPAGKDYKPVEAGILAKLKDLPLKWKNYFEVKRIDFALSHATPQKVPLSEKCQLNVSSQDGSTLEICLVGKGKEVVKRTQSLPKGEILVLGGNAPNATAWLVIIKRID